AGGDIYGGVVSYYPSRTLNMSFSVDRQINISHITSGSPQALGGLSYVAVGVSPTASTQTTSFTYNAHYTLSPQTLGYVVLNDTLIDSIDGPPLSQSSWFADFGLQHQLQHNLMLKLDYQYTRFISPTPQTSFIRNLVSLGASYSF